MKTAVSPTAWIKEWLLFGLLLLVEFALFDQVGAKHVTHLIPRWNDQIQYLGEAYRAQEVHQHQGLGAALRYSLMEPTAQGTLHDAWTTLLFSVTGASRSAALSLNMLLFLGWQTALFICLRRNFGSRALAWGGVALLLSLRVLTAYEQGTPTDFRLDWMAAAWMGITCCAAYSSNNFKSAWGALWFGVCVGLCFGTRFLTGTYFTMIFLGLAAWLIFIRKDSKAFRNLVLAMVATFLVVAPLFWVNRDSILEYYYYGHYVGPESAIRNADFDFFESLDWIIARVYQRHLGLPFMILFGLGTFCYAISNLASAREEAPKEKPSLIIGSLFLLCPVLVLILHPQKSDVVLSVLIAGVSMLGFHLWRPLLAGREQGPGFKVSIALLIGAIGVFLWGTIRNPVPQSVRDDSVIAQEICGRVLRNAEAAKLDHPPRIGIDYCSDIVDAQIFRILYYERTHRWVDTDMTLPSGIDALTPAELKERLERSDFVFITQNPNTEAKGYPFDQMMAAHNQQNRAWCEEHLKMIENYHLGDRVLTLYQRREIPNTP